MRKLIIMLGLFTCAVCGAHETHRKPQTDYQPVHYKPGADVRFTHNYDGKTEPGEYEQLELQFTSYSLADGESMKISLNPSKALEVTEGYKFDVHATNHKMRIPITLKALQNGRHYLGIHAEIVDTHGHRSFRIFELPVQVGEQTVTQHEKATRSAKGRKLKILESTETLNQK